MFRRVVPFLVVYISLVKSAIVIEKGVSDSAKDMTVPETISDVSFGSLIDAVSDFVKSEKDADAMVQIEDNKRADEDFEGLGNSGSAISFPNFDFEVPGGDTGESYYYEDDDTFYYAKDTWYFDPEEPSDEIVIESPLPEPPTVEVGGGTFTVELPFLGSIFNPPPISGQPPAATSSSASHAASDASISSAVNSMMSTPLSNDYQQIAHDAMSRVRSECKADFEDTCTPRSFPSLLGNGIFSLLSSSFFAPFMSNDPVISMAPCTRRLLHGEPMDRMSFLNKLRDHVDGVKHELTHGVSDLKPKLDEMASKFAAFRNGFPRKKLQDTEVTPPDAAPLNVIQPAPFKPIPHPTKSIHLQQGEMMGNIKAVPNMLRGDMMKRHLDEAQVLGKSPQKRSYPDHGSHGRWEGRNEDGFEFVGDEDRHPWEDTDEEYNGELLWGPIGDRCMYDNFDTLSQGCKDAITDVYVIRDQYMNEEENSHRGNVAIFWFFVIAICVVACFKRKARIAKYEKDLAMYNAMQENPALKEQMEKASGVVMEKPKMCGGASCGFFVLRLILSFLSALLALQFAFFVTIMVVENNITYDQYGNEVMPPPIVPFLTFFSSLLIASAFMLCIHQHCFGKKRRRQQQHQEELQQAANEPPSTSSSNWNLPDMRIVWPNWMTRARPSSRDYAVLSGESVHGNQGNEMVIITPSAPAPQAVVVQQTYPSTAAVMSPVNII